MGAVYCFYNRMSGDNTWANMHMPDLEMKVEYSRGGKLPYSGLTYDMGSGCYWVEKDVWVNLWEDAVRVTFRLPVSGWELNETLRNRSLLCPEGEAGVTLAVTSRRVQTHVNFAEREGTLEAECELRAPRLAEVLSFKVMISVVAADASADTEGVVGNKCGLILGEIPVPRRGIVRLYPSYFPLREVADETAGLWTYTLSPDGDRWTLPAIDVLSVDINTASAMHRALSKNAGANLNAVKLEIARQVVVEAIAALTLQYLNDNRDGFVEDGDFPEASLGGVIVNFWGEEKLQSLRQCNLNGTLTPKMILDDAMLCGIGRF